MLIWTWWRRGKQHSLVTELSLAAHFLLNEFKIVWVFVVNPRAEYPGPVGGHLLY
jgi:hypothetical protein